MIVGSPANPDTANMIIPILIAVFSGIAGSLIYFIEIRGRDTSKLIEIGNRIYIMTREFGTDTIQTIDAQDSSIAGKEYYAERYA